MLDAGGVVSLYDVQRAGSPAAYGGGMRLSGGGLAVRCQRQREAFSWRDDAPPFTIGWRLPSGGVPRGGLRGRVVLQLLWCRRAEGPL